MNEPELIERIEKLRGLSYDWDGMGAEGVDGGACDIASSLVESLPDSVDVSRLYIYPTVVGGVVIEVDDGQKNGRQAEVEISRDYNVEAIRIDGVSVETCELDPDRPIMEHFLSAYRWVFRQAETCV